MVRYFFFLILFTAYIDLAADNIDSLENVLQSQTGRARIPTLDKLSRTYDPIAPEVRLKYSHEFLDLSYKAEIDSSIALAYVALGISYYYNSNIDSATYYTDAALKKFIQLKDTSRIAAALLNLGVFYSDMGQFQAALKKYIQSLEIKRAKNDSLGIALALNNIGAIYYDMTEYRKAINNFKESISIHQKMNIKSKYANENLNIAKCYFELTRTDFFENNKPVKNDLHRILYDHENVINLEKLTPAGKALFDSTRTYLMKAFDLYSHYNDEIGLAESKIFLSLIELNLNNLDRAIELLYESEVVLKKYNVYIELAKVKNHQGFIAYLKHNYKQAIELINESISYAKMNSQNDLIAMNLRLLALNYMEINDFKNAAFTFDRLDVLKDSLSYSVVQDSLLAITHKYEVDQKAAQIELMQSNEDVLQQKLIILIISLVLLLTLFFSLTFRFKYKNRINKELAEKNEALNQLNTNLSKSRRELEVANLSKDKLFSIIAHDLRNPLGAFKNVTAILSNDYDTLDSKEIREFIELMNSSAGTLYLLLENLLTWSSTQRGTISYHPSNENIHDLVARTISPLLPLAKSKQIVIINDCDKDAKAKLDANLSSTIIRNLVSNAIKFSNPDSRILIHTKNDPKDMYEICIQDFGVGIPIEVKNNLFIIDKSQSNDGTSGEKGTGLGLIICKEFIEMQGGKIWVESELDKGSTFCITLPKA